MDRRGPTRVYCCPRAVRCCVHDDVRRGELELASLSTRHDQGTLISFSALCRWQISKYSLPLVRESEYLGTR
jgi:hypothetical protein